MHSRRLLRRNDEISGRMKLRDYIVEIIDLADATKILDKMIF